MPTPLCNHAAFDRCVSGGVRVWVMHENHHPTNTFKARNGMAVVAALSPEARRRGEI